MKRILLLVLVLTFFTSCKNTETKKKDNVAKNKFEEVINDSYELIKSEHPKAVLVLFGGYPENAKDNRIAVVYMNYNQKLWLQENEKKKLAEHLQNIFKENHLPTNKIYFGGFSSGGNVALSISDFLTKQNPEITPKGVFAVDSPIDLIALYKSSEKNIARNFSAPSIQESNWLIGALDKQFGNPNNNFSNYENYSIYTSETNNFDNIKNLKNIKIRFYSEPDTLWWKQNRMADFDQMNAYYLERLSKLLKKSNFKHVDYISTENKGYRANGERHPHSWSIVNKKELITWITE